VDLNRTLHFIHQPSTANNTAAGIVPMGWRFQQAVTNAIKSVICGYVFQHTMLNAKKFDASSQSENARSES
jgi:hypothetical protein